jgi:hypothetical protein
MNEIIDGLNAFENVNTLQSCLLNTLHVTTRVSDMSGIRSENGMNDNCVQNCNGEA